MNIILSIGVLIFTGYLLGELAVKVKLPKISGYILAGVITSYSIHYTKLYDIQ